MTTKRDPPSAAPDSRPVSAVAPFVVLPVASQLSSRARTMAASALAAGSQPSKRSCSSGTPGQQATTARHFGVARATKYDTSFSVV